MTYFLLLKMRLTETGCSKFYNCISVIKKFGLFYKMMDVVKEVFVVVSV